jgi:hypothetical protein
MPSSGTSRRRDEPALSHEQSLLAGKFLKKVFDPTQGVDQLTRTKKEYLVRTINTEFGKHGHRRTYSLNKLECWTGNALYRWRCIQKQRRPLSWQPKCAIAATKFAAQKAKREAAAATKASARRNNFTAPPLVDLGLTGRLMSRSRDNSEDDASDTGTPSHTPGAPPHGQQLADPSQGSPSSREAVSDDSLTCTYSYCTSALCSSSSLVFFFCACVFWQRKPW